MRTDAELKQLALEILDGKVYTNLHVSDPNDLASVFMPLMFMNDEQRAELAANPPGMIFQYHEKAGPREINGHPCFFEYQQLSVEEYGRFTPIYKAELDERRKAEVPA